MNGKTTEELLHAYQQTAAEHGQAMEDGRSHRVNAAYDRMTAIRRELHARGPEHYRRLLSFLDDDNAAVRSSAAVDVLEFAPEQGVRVLREVAGQPGMVAWDAEMVLGLWDAGEWDTTP